MKITFDSDAEANEFFHRGTTKIYGAAGALANHPAAAVLNDHGDELCVAYFQHFQKHIDGAATPATKKTSRSAAATLREPSAQLFKESIPHECGNYSPETQNRKDAKNK